MKKLSVRDRILASFGLIFLVMLAIGGFTYSRIERIDSEASAIKTDTTPGLYYSGLIRRTVLENYVLTLRHLLNDTAATGQKESTLLAKNEKLDQFVTQYGATVSTDADRRSFESLKRVLDKYKSSQEMILASATNDSDTRKSNSSIDSRLNQEFRNVIGTIDQVGNENRARGVAAAAMIDDDIASLRIAIVVSFAVALVVALIAGYSLLRAITVPLARLTFLMDAMRQGDFTQRMEIDRQDELGHVADGFNRMANEVMDLVGQVRRSGIRVTTSMTEIAATSKQQQATASEVAATTTEIGATSREIAATSRELVRTMADVAAVSDRAAELASGGHGELAQMEETMSLVMEAASSINAKLAVLNEKAGDINQVVTTITKVADQTNLLSLNAAIEAEKAGEYGRGFAVVSSEIRRLADQTAVATYDIEQMVKEIQSAVSASVMGMDKFSEQVRRGLHEVHTIGDKLSEVITQVQTLAPRFESVSEGMEAQAIGAEQISEALVQLTDATQQTVESLRQSSSAIDELDHVSGNLQDSVARFKLAAA